MNVITKKKRFHLLLNILTCFMKCLLCSTSEILLKAHAFCIIINLIRKLCDSNKMLYWNSIGNEIKKHLPFPPNNSLLSFHTKTRYEWRLDFFNFLRFLPCCYYVKCVSKLFDFHIRSSERCDVEMRMSASKRCSNRRRKIGNVVRKQL